MRYTYELNEKLAIENVEYQYSSKKIDSLEEYIIIRRGQ